MTSIRPSFTQPTEAEIQHAAYRLWLESGRQSGHDLDHWIAAQELLRHRHAPAADRTQRAPNHPRRTPPVLSSPVILG